MSFSVFLSVVGKYIGPLVIYMAIAAAIYIPCRLLYLKRKQRAFAVWHELFLFLFWVYAFGVFSQTVLPRFYIGVTDSGAFYFDTYIPPRTAPNFMQGVVMFFALVVVLIFGTIKAGGFRRLLITRRRLRASSR